VHFEQKEHFWW